MRVKVSLLFFYLCLGYVATNSRTQKIIGGSETTINQYPAIAALLYSDDLSIYTQECGGSILNTRSILTAANCPYGNASNRWRVRVGSMYANSGGTVHSIESVIIHPNFSGWTLDSDIAILRTVTSIAYVNNAVQAALIAGPNYNVVDGSLVWAAGWGETAVGGPASEQLRHVQVWTVNQATCRSRYTAVGWPVTDNMLCSGYLDVGGRDQCQGDNGGPLYHNSVVIGIYSWGYQCALAYYPGVNTRVSWFSIWIQENA